MLVFALAALAAGCGVRFGDPPPDVDVLKGLELEGEKTVGAPLTLTLQVSTGYPVPVEVACYVEETSSLSRDEMAVSFAERATRIGALLVNPTPSITPGERGGSRSLNLEFVPETAGRYFLACLTPGAPENGLGIEFEVAEAG